MDPRADARSHRPAAVAGLFYPADPQALRAELQRCLHAVGEAQAVPPGPHPPKMLVVPHAGYVYSGPIAAHAYAALAPWHATVTRVVLLGPTHRVAVHGLAAPSVEAFDTPLGAVPIDRAALASLHDLPQVVTSDQVHQDEHALEVQLPFLQTVLDHFTLVPFAVGRVDPADVAQVIERLWGGDETLILISTDLSHYLSHAQSHAVDADTIARVLRLDPVLNHQQACGATPLAAALQAARRHGLTPRLLDLRNSGDTAGDRQRVVGYAALAFEGASPSPAGDTLGAALLSRARNTIAAELGLPTQPEPDHPLLHAPGATFVTLHRGGQLRGCIGRLVVGDDTLDSDVRRNAHHAAFQDPRFTPLTADEWQGLEIEVSLLGPAEPLEADSEAQAIAALRPRVDGVILSWQGRRATFLPQVWEQLPEPRQFLAALKQKAGLPMDFWDADVRLLRYHVRTSTKRSRHCIEPMDNVTATPSSLDDPSVRPARWWHALPDGRVQCDLCPRDCKLHEGQRGLCFVRQRIGDGIVLTTHGRSSGFCIDPIEKKPLNHFHPGSRVLSFGTAGCNLACKFCQNWDISKSREMDRLMDQASPTAIAAAAQAHGCKSVAFTYNDPVIFAEYAMETADACHALGVQTVAVTAGYIHAEPRSAFYATMDAANIDLKGFTEAFYFQQTGAHLAPVLDTLQYVRHETDCWLEITTLLIPRLNDSDAELHAMTRWVGDRLGHDVPLHFTAFHPDYKMTDIARTPATTLQRARRIAMDNGLRHVYTGNVHDLDGGRTCCTGCHRVLIERDWHEVLRYDLDPHGRCPHCATPLAGRFDAGAPQCSARRRVPVRLAV